MKAKFINENMSESSGDFYSHRPFGNAPGQERIDRENARKAARFDKSDFWWEVAREMDGELDDFELEEEGRSISIRQRNGDILDIQQSWRYDGSPTKPETTINGNELGRFAIWDDPADVAEDYMANKGYGGHTDADEIDESLNEGFATEEGRNLDRIAGWLGYDDLHEMLGDNPGLFEACVTWIDDTFGEQLAEEGILPEELERVGLYNTADDARRIMGEDE